MVEPEQQRPDRDGDGGQDPVAVAGGDDDDGKAKEATSSMMVAAVTDRSMALACGLGGPVAGPRGDLDGVDQDGDDRGEGDTRQGGPGSAADGVECRGSARRPRRRAGCSLRPSARVVTRRRLGSARHRGANAAWSLCSCLGPVPGDRGGERGDGGPEGWTRIWSCRERRAPRIRRPSRPGRASAGSQAHGAQASGGTLRSADRVADLGGDQVQQGSGGHGLGPGRCQTWPAARSSVPRVASPAAMSGT